MNKLNYVILNLSNQSIHPYLISEEMAQKCLGGKILGAQILLDITEPNLKALSPESVVVINTGPMNGTGAPSSSRFNMTFKNVMTGGIASSNCGGQFGIMLKRAGFDGLIIKGRAEHPICIEIVDGKITITDAKSLWGLNTEEVQEKLPKSFGKLVIGPAGENQVNYACAVSGERVAGRCGSGAVLGAKNIKALIAYGTKMTTVPNKNKFDAYIKQWITFLQHHPMTGIALPQYGSSGLVNKANASGALPTHNFTSGAFEKANFISGETLAEKYLTRNSGCVSCPIRCERRVMVSNKDVKGPEYETVGLFGSNIDNCDLDFINTINYHADLLGMDTISLAGTLSYAMELQEKGMADFGISFGDTRNLMEILPKIACRQGIYSELADGSKVMSEKYGGEAFAIHSKGLELAAYEPRRSVGMGLGYATANRGGCHLNGGYLALVESIGVMTIGSQKTVGKPSWTIFMQNIMEAVSAAGFCLFTLQTLIPAILFKFGPSSRITEFAGKAMLSVHGMIAMLWKFTPGIIPFNTMFLFPHSKAIMLATGDKMTTGRLLEIGERGFTLERLYNMREGLTAADDNLPDRLTKIPQQKLKPDTVVNLTTMMPIYYKIRGWDEKGVPTRKLLKKLRIG
jgi:aldehyde:ferredoxin oxidoreductase